MNRKKLTPEEIQVLRSNAEKERATHNEVMKNIKAMVMSPELQMSTLISSYNRHRNDEILALLKEFCSDHKQYELSTEVKLFIYEHGDEFSDIRFFMMTHNHLGYALEKRIFDDHWSPFLTTNSRKLTYPKFCPDAEAYCIRKTLEACQRADKLSNELQFLDVYTQEYKLSSAGEIALMEFLTIDTGRDSVIDSLASFVLTYLGRHPNITTIAWILAIKAGNHMVIMHFIKNALLTEDASVVNALHERADEEEITAYYDRWAREG